MEPLRLGVIGGMGSVAGADFVSRLTALTPAKADQDYIEVFLHNNARIPDRSEALLRGGPSPVPELRRSVALCDRFGADYIVLACVTAHAFIPELQPITQAEILDGVRLTVDHLVHRHPEVKRAGILASSGNLEVGLFQRPLQAAGITPVLFDADEQQRYFTEPIYAPWGIKSGHVDGRPRERFLQGAQRLVERGAQAILGGCSEIPLILRPSDLPVPLINTMDILCLTAMERCLGPLVGKVNP